MHIYLLPSFDRLLNSEGASAVSTRVVPRALKKTNSNDAHRYKEQISLEKRKEEKRKENSENKSALTVGWVDHCFRQVHEKNKLLCVRQKTHLSVFVTHVLKTFQ